MQMNSLPPSTISLMFVKHIANQSCKLQIIKQLFRTRSLHMWEMQQWGGGLGAIEIISDDSYR